MGKISINQREIYLVPFPFSDFSNKKVRPVVIVSNNKFNLSSDVIVCAITSNILKDFYSVYIENLEEGSLDNPCCVKSENILKIDKNLLIKKIGKLRKEDFSKIVDKINKIIKE